MESPLFPYRFAYLIGSFYLLSIWAFLLWRIPTHRRLSITFGLAYMWFAVLGVFLWYTIDWWHPETITFTRVGIEDLFASFVHFALPPLLGRYLFRYTSSVNTADGGFRKLIFHGFIFLFVVLTLIPGVLFYFFHIHSFTALNMTLAATSLLIMIRRPDLFFFSLLNGFLMFLTALSMFLIGALTFPGIVQNFWDFSTLSGEIFLTAPVEDLVFYALWGFFMGSFYEFLFGLRLKRTTGSFLQQDVRTLLYRRKESLSRTQG